MNKKIALDIIYLILKCNEDWEYPYVYGMVEEIMKDSKGKSKE